jgi:hypothetical protein
MPYRILFMIVFFGVFQSVFSAMSITENTAQKFVFEWTTDHFKIAAAGPSDMALSFTGENIDLGDNGEPVVPAYSFYLGLPRQGAASVRVVVKASHTETLQKPIHTRNAPGTSPRYPGLRFSDPFISDVRYAQFGRLKSGQFILRPVIYNSENGIVQVLDRAEITIEFPPSSTVKAAPLPSKSDYGNMLKRLILNYAVAQSWAESPQPKRAVTKEYPLPPTQTMISFRIGDGRAGFNEGTINENGILKLTGADIVRLLGSLPKLSRVALYASYKGELPTVVPSVSQLSDGVTEIPMIRVDANGNDVLDPEDYLLAYVSSISDWVYDKDAGSFEYSIDRYDDYRHYWITVKNEAGLSLEKMVPLIQPASETVTSGRGLLHLMRSELPSSNQGHDGGLEWVWTKMNSYVPEFSIDNVVLQNIDPAVPCSLYIGEGSSGGSLGIKFGGATLCEKCSYGDKYAFTYGENHKLTLSVNAGPSDTFELKYIEFKYSQKLDMTGATSMTIFSPEIPGVARYRLSGIPKELVYILRIADRDAAINLVDTVSDGGAIEWVDSTGIGVRYYVCTRPAFKDSPPLDLVPIKSGSDYTVRDLRNPSIPIDYLIVSHPNFMVQAQRLARHKLNIGTFDFPRAISITDVYDQFSGGNTDPAALRNALLYVRDRVATFEYVVLMGLGHYDYRNIATRDTSFIPVALFGTKCLEDFFVYLEPPGESPDLSSATPDCFIGRIPCQTAQTAAQMVDKIIQTEDPTSADFSAWRNRALLVADDDMQGPKDDQLRTAHLASSELVDTLISHLQPSIDIRKVTLFEYEKNAQYEKPDATQALINGINNGAAVVNYFGHGSSSVWADEHIFLAENIGSLQNNAQYPLICSFSCSVGKFDQPGKKRSLAEYLVLAQKKGAIATISATREAYASDNEKLARNFFSSVYDTSDAAARTYGEALAFAKSLSKDDNQKVYSYLGDPSIPPLRPTRKISLSITNQIGTPIDTIKALMLVIIKGEVTKKDGASDESFGSAKPAYVQISMFNPPYMATRKDIGPVMDVTYKLPGTPIFIGKTQVKNGAFEQRILVPKNVTFDQSGACLSAYAWEGASIATGYRKDFVFSGFDTMRVSDTTGPCISVRPVYKGASAEAVSSAGKGASSTDKITAPLPLTIEISISDSNGIDAVSTGPDEGITFEVPGVVPRKNINHTFQFGQGDYRKGTATWSFNEGDMTPGSYKMVVTAQDLLGNVARNDIAFEVSSAQELGLYHVFNFPNPMRMGSTAKFYFDLTKTVSQSTDDRVTVSIRIFTLSGRLVRVFNDARRGEEFDGKDNFGNPLSPGVYLYQLIAVDRVQQKVVKSGIEKLAINPPR